MSSSVRKIVSDFAGNDLAVGDLVVSGSRVGNRVRLSEYIIAAISMETAPRTRRILPVLEVIPNGVESGFVKRASHRRDVIGTEHVRLVEPGYAQRHGVDLGGK
ncbi:hypothetical protein [Streptomyces sp. NPDC007063]|uniref:hypothetical protein n=1 Tax=Streptomyces sp. NPDC007063 TaxID=3364772 RepID=UPI0036AEB4C8